MTILIGSSDAATQPTPIASPYGGRVLFSTRGALVSGQVNSDVFGAKVAETGQVVHTAPYDGFGLRFLYVNDGTHDITLKVSLVGKTGLSSSTIFKVYFSGQRTVTLPPNGSVWSDPVGIPLLAGDTFRERVYVTVAVAENWRPNVFILSSRGEGVDTTDVTDTTSGITNGDGWCYGSCAITADAVPQGTVTTALGVVGDSISAGQGDSFSQGPLYGYIARLLDGDVPFVNCGIGGTSASQWKAGTNQDVRGPLLDLPNVYIAHGTNDAGTGNAASLQASLQAIYDQYPNASVFAATITPRPSSASDWVTGAGQVVNTTHETNSSTVNTWIRTTPSPLAGFVEIRSAVEAGTPGTWKPAYSDDGVHPTSTGHAAMAVAGASLTPLLRTVTV